MTNEIDFTTMPHDYTVCWHPDCPMGEQCLRHLAIDHLPERKLTVASVNLRAVAPETGECPHQRPTRLVKYAYGMRQIYRNVRVCDKEKIYHEIWSALGNSMYYRYRNGERPITPEVQAIIASAFRRHGYAEPVAYDRVVEAQAW